MGKGRAPTYRLRRQAKGPGKIIGGKSLGDAEEVGSERATRGVSGRGRGGNGGIA